METSKSYVVSINESAAGYLYKSASWTTFFAVLGYIAAALLLLMAMFVLVSGGLISRFNPAVAQMPFNFAWLGVIYLPIAALYIWTSTLMLGFASKAKQALKDNDDDMIEQSFKKMKQFLTIFGVMTIALLVLYFFMIIAMIVGSISGMSGPMI